MESSIIKKGNVLEFLLFIEVKLTELMPAWQAIEILILLMFFTLNKKNGF